MPLREFRVGVLGAGMIASHPGGVLPNLASIGSRVNVVAITSRTRSRAEEVAARFGIPRVRDTLTEMLADDDLDVVVNLTPGPAHSETNLEILEAGKHLISEKPLATNVPDADALIEIATDRRLLIVAAPPWMLDPRRVWGRDFIRRGAIGRVAFARSRSSHAGPAAMSWPADPSWAYGNGAGALFEMGVYGITEVTGILGPVKRVISMSGITETSRIGVGGLFDGRTIDVIADDNTLLLLDFGDATFAVVDATYNVHDSRVQSEPGGVRSRGNAQSVRPILGQAGTASDRPPPGGRERSTEWLGGARPHPPRGLATRVRPPSARDPPEPFRRLCRHRLEAGSERRTCQALARDHAECSRVGADRVCSRARDLIRLLEYRARRGCERSMIAGRKH